MLARMAIMAITTSNSIRVNAEEVLFIFIWVFLGNEARVIVVFPEQVNNYFWLFFGRSTPDSSPKPVLAVNISHEPTRIDTKGTADDHG
jgi:hypothetical protein